MSIASCTLGEDFEATFHFELEGHQVSLTVKFDEGEDPFLALDMYVF